ncbi:membrane protein [Beutenbergia cavernae DSM 12333]|uniref:Membrane protein n=1 Tax=Beutenbergia cavernae (strain ATCC BAA-8 / DSM 12333 / CCUG 43141 / JCM 11478 / NBRC 16432 / NCIMB 13614 / HKI 0122) TaxID=471853 RepID=C5BYP9_BEUC1|nr:PrsW family intramembrane metalloprotease [Beutenbergia cavernae]ACQ79007.1 membrane protein [Beutenbergia cavernae DSM 12333]
MSTTTFRPEPVRPTGRLRDVRQLMWWLFLVLLVVGVAGYLLMNISYALLAPQAFGIGVVFAILLAALLLWIISKLDVAGAPPTAAYVAVFAWGGLTATTLAVVANDNMIAVYDRIGLGSWAAALAAPTDEETAKLLGVVVVLYLVRRIRPRPIDGLILGAVCGVGFEVVENVLYAVQTAVADPNSDVTSALGTSVLRIVVGFGGHAIFAGCAGYGMAVALGKPGLTAGKRVGTAFGMWAVAWILHSLWDSPVTFGLEGWQSILVIPIKYGLMIVAFVLAYRAAARTEYEWLTTAFRGVPADVVSPSDVHDLTSRSARHAARARAREHGGPEAVHALKDVQHAQLALADLLRDVPASSPIVARQAAATVRLRAQAVASRAVPTASGLMLD